MARAVQFAACEHIGVSTIQTLSEATGLINNVEPYSPGRTLKPVKTVSHSDASLAAEDLQPCMSYCY